MIPLSLREVAGVLGATPYEVDDDAVVDAVVTDSRQAGPGALFVPLRGERADGHDFVADARRRGASAHLTERRPVGPGALHVTDTWAALARLGQLVRDRVDPTVVAVTGSVGKTTTKDLVAAAVAADRATVASPASFNNELGVPLTLLACEADTEVLVVEIGARGVGDIAGLASLVRPDVAVVTAVAAAHLELFADLDTVARAKGELVEALGGDGVAVLNAADPRVLAMAGRAAGRVVTYGTPEADVRARDVVLDRLARPSFAASCPGGEVAVSLPIAGLHQVGNALAALAVADGLGVGLDAAAAALASAPVSRWRSEVREAGGAVVLNDAYNANPVSTAAALRTLVAVERTGRTWAVLGTMAELGAGAETDHRDVGALAAELGVDRLVTVGELGARIDAGAARAGLPAGARDQVDDAAAALELLTREVASGDVVLVKASRVAGLERVATGLLEARGAAA